MNGLKFAASRAFAKCEGEVFSRNLNRAPNLPSRTRQDYDKSKSRIPTEAKNPFDSSALLASSIRIR